MSKQMMICPKAKTCPERNDCYEAEPHRHDGNCIIGVLCPMCVPVSKTRKTRKVVRWAVLDEKHDWHRLHFKSKRQAQDYMIGISNLTGPFRVEIEVPIAKEDKR